MKSSTRFLTVAALSVALLGGLLLAVHAQAGPGTPAAPPILDAGPAPAVAPWAPALAVTQPFTIYQPLAAKDCFGFLMYADDFDDPDSGWYVGEIPEVRWSYQNGEYEILISTTSSFAAVTVPFQAVDGYALEFDVRRLGGTGNLYGAVFGWSDWGHYYVFAVAPDTQHYSVYRLSGEDWQAVIEWNTSPSIHPGDATNRLRLERSGSQLTIYANGDPLATRTDGTYTGALRVGLYAEVDESAPVATRYDNLLITQLSNGLATGRGALPGSETWTEGHGRIARLLCPLTADTGSR
jgi:hypothetical protein